MWSILLGLDVVLAAEGVCGNQCANDGNCTACNVPAQSELVPSPRVVADRKRRRANHNHQQRESTANTEDNADTHDWESTASLFPRMLQEEAPAHVDAVLKSEGTTPGPHCKAAGCDPSMIFKHAAYIRAPDSLPLRETPMGVKFTNFHDRKLNIYYDNGSWEGVFSGSIRPYGGVTATNTYTTHKFIFKHEDGTEHARITIAKGKNLYIIHPTKDVHKQMPKYQRVLREAEFMDKYMNRTGQPWLAPIGRAKPRLPIWSTDYIGQQHEIQSKHGYWDEDTGKPRESFSMNLTVLSRAPRVLALPNLISSFEAAHIKKLASLQRSQVGNSFDPLTSNTRTSYNGWLSREQTPIIDNIFSRFADVLQIPDSELTHDKVAENLQVLRYRKGEEYANHHDFGYTGRANQRYATLLLHIDESCNEDYPLSCGGGTGFPKAFNGRGLKVRPPKRSGALFYSMLPDGNADDLSVHAGMPVLEGEKWVCNLWVWDPYRWDTGSY